MIITNILLVFHILVLFHSPKRCAKSVQICSFSWSVFSCIRAEYRDFLRKSPVFSPNTGKYGPEKTPCLDTFHAA